MIGKTLNRYHILEKLGQGGMGVVYLAEDTSLERKVALKFLTLETDRDPLARERFLLEAKAAAAIDHPYICKIHEAGELEGRAFIAMEYVPGKSLRQRISAGPIPLEEALTIAREIAGALDAAHERGIVHRDLKPSNILLPPRGHAKVMDFGLAKRLTTGSEAAVPP